MKNQKELKSIKKNEIFQKKSKNNAKRLKLIKLTYERVNEACEFEKIWGK